MDLNLKVKRDVRRVTISYNEYFYPADSDFNLVVENLAQHVLDMFIDPSGSGWKLSDYWQEGGFTVLEFTK